MGKIFNFNQAQSYKQDSDVCFIEGDVFANIKKIPDESVNLVISSPPYNLNKEYEEKKAFDIYLKDMQPLLHELKRVIKNDGAICWQLGNYLTKSTSKKPAEIFPLDIFFYNEFKSLGFKLRNRIIWHFRSGMHAKKRLSGRYETMMWFSKSDDFIFNLDQIRVKQKYQGKVFPKSHKKAGQLSGNPNGMNPSDFWIFDYMADEFKSGIWDIPNVKANHPEKTQHPCSFPIELVERCVKAFTNKGDVVLDPFSGVGSTGVGALKNHRKAIICELDKEYMSIAKKRVNLLEKGELPYRKIGTPIKEATGKVAKKVFEEN